MWKQSPYKDDFIGAGDKVYLNTAAEGLFLKETAKSFLDYSFYKSLGTRGRTDFFKTHLESRKEMARMLGVPFESVCFLGNASEAMGMISNSLELKEGDEVITNDLEFPSGILTWLRLQETKGIKVNILRHKDWRIPEEFYRETINEKTRVVFVSFVSYKNGLRADIKRIAELAHEAGAYCIVDATQGLGRVPLPVEGVDFLMSSSFKWLCSSHGLGIVYCNPALLETLNPDRLGWWSVDEEYESGSLDSYTLKNDAVRLEVGMPNFPALYSLRAALTYLNAIGVEKIDRELEPICMRLCEGLQKLGLQPLTPLSKDGHAGIFVFAHPQSEKIVADLEKQNIYIWYRPGRIRIAVHLYNDMNDIERLLSAIAPLLDKHS